MHLPQWQLKEPIKSQIIIYHIQCGTNNIFKTKSDIKTSVIINRKKKSVASVIWFNLPVSDLCIIIRWVMTQKCLLLSFMISPDTKVGRSYTTKSVWAWSLASSPGVQSHSHLPVLVANLLTLCPHCIALGPIVIQALCDISVSPA